MSGPAEIANAEAEFATATNAKPNSNIVFDADTTENGMDSLVEPLLPPVIPPAVPPDTSARVLDSNIVETDAVAVVIEFNESEWGHGETQPERCRDWFWGFLFFLQFAVVFVLAIMGIQSMAKEYSESMAGDDDHRDSVYNIDRENVLLVLSLVGSAIAISCFLINVLLGAFASMLIQISLVVPPLSCFVTAVASLLTFNVPVAFFSLIMSIMGAYFAFAVWNKIPFATANLKIALSAIGDNHGLWILAYAVSMQACAWMLLWCSAVTELVKYSSSWVFDCSNVDDETGEPVCHVSTPGTFIALGMIFSFFWTNQVLNNIFHTTIAGVVGTWWFNPEEETQSARRRSGWCGCSPAIYDSWIRSSFYSFGSICFGSSLVGILQVLQLIVYFGRKRRQEQRRLEDTGPNATDFLCCLLQFLVDKLELVMEYFNSWAFVYVGLYGYDYWSAGKQVRTLFIERGWDVIVNDQLVARSLSMMSWLISLVTGLVGVFLGYAFLGLGFGIFPVFFFSAFLGRASCQVLLGVVTSAVDTVVVCFAESPNQLRNKHDPELFRDLIHAWRKAYPEDCGF